MKSFFAKFTFSPLLTENFENKANLRTQYQICFTNDRIKRPTAQQLLKHKLILKYKNHEPVKKLLQSAVNEYVDKEYVEKKEY